MPQRKGRSKPEFLSVQEWAEIDRITKEIMAGTELQRPYFARHVKQVLARNIMETRKKHEAALAVEETHTWEFGQHHISECRIDWCGRYRGQRRNSGDPVVAKIVEKMYDEPDPGA